MNGSGLQRHAWTDLYACRTEEGWAYFTDQRTAREFAKADPIEFGSIYVTDLLVGRAATEAGKKKVG